MRYLESKIQKEIVRAIKYMLPKSVIWSTPNEGKRNVRFASVLKDNGLLNGVSDLICINNGKIYFLEVKTEKGKQTEYQKEFQNKIESQGFQYHVVKSVQDALKIINQ